MSSFVLHRFLHNYYDDAIFDSHVGSAEAVELKRLKEAPNITRLRPQSQWSAMEFPQKCVNAGTCFSV